jgi:hypothetical protein
MSIFLWPEVGSSHSAVTISVDQGKPIDAMTNKFIQ